MEKTRLCHICGQDIPIDEKVCSYCNKKSFKTEHTSNTQIKEEKMNKKSHEKNLGLVILLIVLLFIPTLINQFFIIPAVIMTVFLLYMYKISHMGE